MRQILAALIILGLTTTALAGGNYTAKLEPRGVAITIPTEQAVRQGIISASLINGKWYTVQQVAAVTVTPKGIRSKSMVYHQLDEHERNRANLIPAGDTLFADWYHSGSDSGHFIVMVDEVGDSLTIVRYSHQAKAGLNAGWGGVAGGKHGDAPQLLCTDYEKITSIRQAGLTDFWNGAGAANSITTVDTVKTIHTKDCIQWRDEWYHTSTYGDDSTLLHVKRTLTARRGLPQFVIRYKFRSADSTNNGDTIRFVLSEDPSVGTDQDFDLFWHPSYGEVRRNHVFDKTPMPFAACLNIGNAKASNDTTGGGNAYMNTTLRYDFGSGNPAFVGVWLAFNGNASEIETVAFTDTLTIWERLEYDSTLALYGATKMDSTYVIDGKNTLTRCVHFRTEPLHLDLVNWVTVEYAVGRAYFLTAESPVQLLIPPIYWTDGAVTHIDTGVKR